MYSCNKRYGHIPTEDCEENECESGFHEGSPLFYGTAKMLPTGNIVCVSCWEIELDIKGEL